MKCGEKASRLIKLLSGFVNMSRIQIFQGEKYYLRKSNIGKNVFGKKKPYNKLPWYFIIVITGISYI